jgi:SNF2 family DNA or RNA helicase
MSPVLLVDANLLFNVSCRFINRISNAYQMEEPPQFHGGIIADPMGLGKTLTMISLIATDLDRDRYADSVMNQTAGDSVHHQTTLVIVPAPCMFSRISRMVWLA